MQRYSMTNRAWKLHRIWGLSSFILPRKSTRDGGIRDTGMTFGSGQWWISSHSPDPATTANNWQTPGAPNPGRYTRAMKIQDRRLRPVSGWDSPLHGRQAWRFVYVDSLLRNRLCVTLSPSGVYINRRVYSVGSSSQCLGHLRESWIKGSSDSRTIYFGRTVGLWRYKIEDFVPCPDGTLLCMEGRLGNSDI